MCWLSINYVVLMKMQVKALNFLSFLIRQPHPAITPFKVSTFAKSKIKIVSVCRCKSWISGCGSHEHAFALWWMTCCASARNGDLYALDWIPYKAFGPRARLEYTV